MLILVVRFAVALLQQLMKWEWLYYVAIFVGIIFFISLCDELNDRFKRIPFGPLRFPAYGNRPQLALFGGRRPYKAVTRLAQGYPDGFMKIFFGLSGYVSVNGNERIAEVIGSDEWAAERDDTWRLDRTDTEKKSASSIMVWVSRRNIAIRCLKEHTFSRNEALNAIITKQVSDFLAGIENQERVDKLAMREMSSETFLPYILSTVWAVLTGDQGVEVTDRRVQTIHRCLKEWEEKSIGLALWADHYPFLLRWFPGWAGLNKLGEVNHDFRKVLKSLIKEQYTKAEKAGKLNPESFVQACIREFKELRKQSFGGAQINDSSSIALLFEFLCPGPLIASSHVGFCLSLAARDPEAQRRIVAEINSTFGPTDIPTSAKMDKMPFTSAFILETARISTIVPFERRKLLKIVRQGETRFPTDMPLLINYHSANVESKVWGNPEVFDPQRFLSPKGKLINEDKLISLTAERHLCAGQPLFRMIIFSFLTGTLQKFQLDLNPNWADKGPHFGIINKPQPFKVKLKPRI